MSTDPTLQPISEEFTLTDGEGLIDVRGDAAECGLLVDQRPTAIFWPADMGSVAEYMARSRVREGVSERLQAMRYVAASGIDSQRSLAEQIRPLLALFAPGNYRLLYVPSGAENYQVPWDWDGESCSVGNGTCIYPEPTVLIPLQLLATLRPDRVQYFEERIALGCRPVAFATSVVGADTSFLLDGHHKVRAYEQVQTPPAVLIIQRRNPLPLSEEEGLCYLLRTLMGGDGLSLPDEYRRYKRANAFHS